MYVRPASRRRIPKPVRRSLRTLTGHRTFRRGGGGRPVNGQVLRWAIGPLLAAHLYAVSTAETGSASGTGPSTAPSDRSRWARRCWRPWEPWSASGCVVPRTCSWPHRGPSVVLRAVLEVWLIGCAVFVVTAGTALLLTTFSVHGGPFTVAALLLGPAVLAVASSLGVLAGYCLPSWVTVAATAPGVLRRRHAGSRVGGGAFVKDRSPGLGGSGLRAEHRPCDRCGSRLPDLALCVVWMGVRHSGLRVVATLGCVAPLVGSLVMAAAMSGDRFEPGN